MPSLLACGPFAVAAVALEGRTRLSPPAGQTVDVVSLRFVGNDSPGGFLYPIRHRVAVESGRLGTEGSGFDRVGACFGPQAVNARRCRPT